MAGRGNDERIAITENAPTGAPEARFSASPIHMAGHPPPASREQHWTRANRARDLEEYPK